MAGRGFLDFRPHRGVFVVAKGYLASFSFQWEALYLGCLGFVFKFMLKDVMDKSIGRHTRLLMMRVGPLSRLRHN